MARGSSTTPTAKTEIYGVYKWDAHGTSMIGTLYTSVNPAAKEAEELSSESPGTRGYVVRWRLDQPGTRKLVLEYQGGKLRFDFTEKLGAA